MVDVFVQLLTLVIIVRLVSPDLKLSREHFKIIKIIVCILYVLLIVERLIGILAMAMVILLIATFKTLKTFNANVTINTQVNIAITVRTPNLLTLIAKKVPVLKFTTPNKFMTS
jgi:hypothetical protein